MSALGRLTVDNNELWWLREGDGSHGDTPGNAEAVVASLKGAFVFAEETDTTAARLPRTVVADLNALPSRIDTRMAGLFLLVPDLVAMDPGIVTAAGYPGTRDSSSGCQERRTMSGAVHG